MAIRKRNLKVGLITDGKYGDRAFNNIKKFFTTEWILIPEIPSTIILDDDLNLDIPPCDLYISYVRHPDVILEIAALQKPLILGITPGRGLLKQAQSINQKVLGPRTMCSLKNNTNIEEIDRFAEYFGEPKFTIELSNDLEIMSIKVKRSSPCGSTIKGAEFLQGKKLCRKTLQDFALTICHECRAPRFGHTCDKELAGVIHILSFFKSFKSNDFTYFEDDLKTFLGLITEEYIRRTQL